MIDWSIMIIMKKIVAFMVVLLSTFAVVAGTELKPTDTNNVHVIRLSKLEWDNVRYCVETNGFCRIPSQNAAIVITNGLSDVELVVPVHYPMGRGADKNPYYKYRRQEPLPYVGQMY